ncbi:MAG: LPS export ABC transporter periplasmic protein LptC [Gammaproteobacteria bacterium]|nr:LPS export ABC transporter periplasmic protein LptC [Gammaproteobacteria bacterium]
MIRLSKNSVIGVVLLLWVAASGWLSRVEERPSQYRADTHAPDYYLQSFTASTMGIDGRMEKQLSAARMEHFPDDDSTELESPVLSIHDAERPPWRIRSERGWVSGDKQLLLLQGQVHIDREEAQGVRPLHIVTRDLRVQPDNNYAETDAEAHATSREDWLTSVGMQLWFARPIRVKLLSQARGRYEIE